jgi:hypothetical protein
MENKEVYRQKIEAQLNVWKAELEVLKAKAKLAEADAKIEIQDQVKKLEAKLGEANVKINQLADSTEEAWDVVKDGAETMWANLKQTFNEAKSKFDKQ